MDKKYRNNYVIKRYLMISDVRSIKNDDSSEKDDPLDLYNQYIDLVCSGHLEELKNYNRKRLSRFKNKAINSFIKNTLVNKNKDFYETCMNNVRIYFSDTHFDKNECVRIIHKAANIFCDNYYFIHSLDERIVAQESLINISNAAASLGYELINLDRYQTNLVSEQILRDIDKKDGNGVLISKILRQMSRINHEEHGALSDFYDENGIFHPDETLIPDISIQERWYILIAKFINIISSRVSDAAFSIPIKESALDIKGIDRLSRSLTLGANVFIKYFERSNAKHLGRPTLILLMKVVFISLLPEAEKAEACRRLERIARSALALAKARSEDFVKEEPLELEGGDEVWSSSEGR